MDIRDSGLNRENSAQFEDCKKYLLCQISEVDLNEHYYDLYEEIVTQDRKNKTEIQMFHHMVKMNRRKDQFGVREQCASILKLHNLIYNADPNIFTHKNESLRDSENLLFLIKLRSVLSRSLKDKEYDKQIRNRLEIIESKILDFLKAKKMSLTLQNS